MSAVAGGMAVSLRLKRDTFILNTEFETASDSVALFGPSGAGKSTVLSLIAGLIRPDNGRIQIGERVLVDTDKGIWMPPHRRRIGLVFQDSMLFPHMTVAANLRYGERPGEPVPATSRMPIRFADVVDLLGIGHLLHRRPVSLSGGERQRVAIGRALLAAPGLLLLDEPLASLDYARRQEIMPYLARLRAEMGMPIIYVSHALEEVVRLVDEVVLMRHGKVISQGAPQELLMPLASDDSSFGVVSVLEAQVLGFNEDYGLTELDHPAGRISLPGRIAQPGDTHRILVRATDVAVAVSRPREISHRTLLRARITDCHRDDGPLVRLDLALHGRGRLAALITRKAMDELGVDRGDEVFALAKASAMDDRSFFR